MTQSARLMEFVRAKVKDLDKEIAGELTPDTSLLKSGLFDSLAILQLAAWVERELGRVEDLSGIDIAEEWDSIGLILQFIERRNGHAKP